MFEDVGDRAFVDFLAALWESQGWETAITERGEGVYMITGDKPDGQRGLMLVVPAEDATIPARLLQKVLTVVVQKEIDMGVAATRGTFSDDARRLAEANSLYLLDTETLEETVVAEGLQDLVERFSNGSGGGGTRLDWLALAGGFLPRPSFGGGVRRLLGVVLALGILVALVQFLGMGAAVGGVAAGLPVPDLGIGIGDADGYTITAVSLSEGDRTPVELRWDARTQKTVIAPNGASFTAPEGQTYLVVQLNVTNPGGDSLIFRPGYITVATDNTRYQVEPLQGASDQLPIVVEAGSSVTGYAVFTVPADSTSGTLLGLSGPDVPPMTFERDRSLEFQVTRE